MNRNTRSAAILCVALVSISSQVCAISLRMGANGSTMDVPSIQVKKRVFLRAREVEANLPLIIRRDSDAGLSVLCTEFDCIPMFGLDPEQIQVRDSVDYFEAGCVARALGYEAKTSKSEITFTCGEDCARERVGTDENDRAPGFRLSGSGDTLVALADLRRPGPVVLAFVRSLEWDPFSRDLARKLQSVFDSLRAANVRPVIIHGYGSAMNAAWRDSLALSFPILADETSSVMRGYDVFDRGNLSFPAIFLIDSKGMIRYRRVFTEFNDPPDLAELMVQIQKARN